MYSSATREQLKEIWRAAVENAEKRYREAAADYWEVRHQPVPKLSELTRASKAEAEALIEYSKAIRVFSSLASSRQPPFGRNLPRTSGG